MHKYLHYRGLRKRSEKGAENITEDIIAENLPHWERKQTSKCRKHRESHTGLTQKRNTSRHIVTKMTKIKDKQRIQEAARKLP